MAGGRQGELREAGGGAGGPDRAPGLRLRSRPGGGSLQGPRMGRRVGEEGVRRTLRRAGRNTRVAWVILLQGMDFPKIVQAISIKVAKL